MKGHLIAAAMIGVWASAAMAAQPLMGDQLALAMWDAAMFVADRCPKTQLVKQNIRANMDGAGIVPYQAMGDEWKTAMARAEVQSLFASALREVAGGDCAK